MQKTIINPSQRVKVFRVSRYHEYFIVQIYLLLENLFSFWECVYVIKG